MQGSMTEKRTALPTLDRALSHKEKVDGRTGNKWFSFLRGREE
jgi:hypothetical protein